MSFPISVTTSEFRENIKYLSKYVFLILFEVWNKIKPQKTKLTNFAPFSQFKICNLVNLVGFLLDVCVYVNRKSFCVKKQEKISLEVKQGR